LAKASGALIGWRRFGVGRSAVFEFQVAPSAEALEQRSFETVTLSLSPRRLGSLARDLTRAAQAEGVTVWPRRRWWWNRR
jgi:hypothetical protein